MTALLDTLSATYTAVQDSLAVPLALPPHRAVPAPVRPLQRTIQLHLLTSMLLTLRGMTQADQHEGAEVPRAAGAAAAGAGAGAAEAGASSGAQASAAQLRVFRLAVRTLADEMTQHGLEALCRDTHTHADGAAGWPAAAAGAGDGSARSAGSTGSGAVFLAALRLMHCAVVASVTDLPFTAQEAWRAEVRAVPLPALLAHLAGALSRAAVAAGAPAREHDYSTWAAQTAAGREGQSTAPPPAPAPPGAATTATTGTTGTTGTNATHAPRTPSTAVAALAAVLDLAHRCLSAGALTAADTLTGPASFLHELVYSPALAEYQRTLLAQPPARAAALMGYSAVTGDAAGLAGCWERAVDIMALLLRRGEEVQAVIEAALAFARSYAPLLQLPFTPPAPADFDEASMTVDGPPPGTGTGTGGEFITPSRLTIRRVQVRPI